MTLTRFEFCGTGIFHCLKMFDIECDMLVADEQDLFDAVEIFERDMPVPDICTSNMKTKSYFKDFGLERFGEEIDTMLFYFREYLYPFGAVNTEVIEYVGDILYQDDYQVVVAA